MTAYRKKPATVVKRRPIVAGARPHCSIQRRYDYKRGR